MFRKSEKSDPIIKEELRKLYHAEILEAFEYLEATVFADKIFNDTKKAINGPGFQYVDKRVNTLRDLLPHDESNAFRDRLIAVLSLPGCKESEAHFVHQAALDYRRKVLNALRGDIETNTSKLRNEFNDFFSALRRSRFGRKMKVMMASISTFAIVLAICLGIGFGAFTLVAAPQIFMCIGVSLAVALGISIVAGLFTNFFRRNRMEEENSPLLNQWLRVLGNEDLPVYNKQRDIFCKDYLEKKEAEEAELKSRMDTEKKKVERNAVQRMAYGMVDASRSALESLRPNQSPAAATSVVDVAAPTVATKPSGFFSRFVNMNKSANAASLSQPQKSAVPVKQGDHDDGVPAVFQKSESKAPASTPVAATSTTQKDPSNRELGSDADNLTIFRTKKQIRRAKAAEASARARDDSSHESAASLTGSRSGE